MTESRRVVAIDLGGTKALAGLVDADGRVLSRVWATSRDLRDQPDELLDRLADAARAAARQGGSDVAAISAIGVCVPGPLDAERAVVAVAPNLGWHDLPAANELQRRLPGLRVFLENDVRAAALSEHVLGAGKGLPSLIAVFIGSGVGGGVVVNGRLYHGAHGSAGEIGHVVVSAGGDVCPCGQRGCVEAYAARDGIARYVQRAAADGRATVLSEMLSGDLAALTSRDLAQAIAAGDRVARDAAQQSARYVGLAVGGLVNVLDPAIVVIGGGITEAAGDEYVEWVAQGARPQILSNRARGLPIARSQLGDDAGLLGAALSALLRSTDDAG